MSTFNTQAPFLLGGVSPSITSDDLQASVQSVSDGIQAMQNQQQLQTWQTGRVLDQFVHVYYDYDTSTQLPTASYFVCNAYRADDASWQKIDPSGLSWALMFDMVNQASNVLFSGPGTTAITWQTFFSLAGAGGGLIVQPQAFDQVWVVSGGGVTYTDVTAYAKTSQPDSPSSGFNGFSVWAAMNDYLYVGSVNQFTFIDFGMQTYGGGLTLTWQYWNGAAWTTFTPVGGGPNFQFNTSAQLQASGTNGGFLTGWQPTSVNGSAQLFYVRIQVTATPTTVPVMSSISPTNRYALEVFAQQGDSAAALKVATWGQVGINCNEPVADLHVRNSFTGGGKVNIFLDGALSGSTVASSAEIWFRSDTTSNGKAVRLRADQSGNIFVDQDTTASNPFLNNYFSTYTTVGQVNGGCLPGTIVMYGGTTAPSGWLLCNGASLSTTTFANLFAAIGYNYGGSGTSFNAPNLQGRFPLGFQSGVFNIGTSGGSTSISAANLPSHTHGSGTLSGSNTHAHQLSGATATGSFSAPAGTNAGSVGTFTFNGLVQNTTITVTMSGSTAATGSGSAYLQPYQVVNYIIKT